MSCADMVNALTEIPDYQPVMPVWGPPQLEGAYGDMSLRQLIDQFNMDIMEAMGISDVAE